ncbi:MAG: LysM peptidoglycan-binding domain-containing protein, partial [Acidobacteriota bacterium]
SANLIRVGQVLLIPSRKSSGTSRRSNTASARPTPSATPSTYRVRSGDTLSVIAQRHGTTVRAIKAANNLRGSTIRVGQRLTLPAGGAATHVVRSGDTLFKIAQRYGTTVAAIKASNRLRGSVIRPSQVLIIP